MARPKLNTPKKQKLTLTVSAQTRAELAFLSQQAGESISELVAAWAAQEARKVAKRNNVNVPEAPDPAQMTIDDLEGE